MQRGSILLLALVLSSLLVVCFAETDALPQGCATGGTKITLRAGGASLSLDSASNFKVQPVVGVDKLVIDASRGALPVFKGDVSFGPATANCLGLLAVNNGDLQAFIRPSLLAPAAWTSLSLSSPIATDATTDTAIQNELYQVSTCGGPLESAGRVSSCASLSTANELRPLGELQALTSATAALPFADPTLALGASSISNSISKTIAVSFGAVYASAAAGLQNTRRTIVFRTQGTTPEDIAFRNQFNAYAVPSFDPISGAVYNTYDINGATVTPIGREFWLSNYGYQDGFADASNPSALLLHYNCPQAAAETQRSCSTVALITGGDTGATLGFSTDQPAPLAQLLPITPANFAPGANYIIRHPQLAIDSKGLIHIFFFTSATAAFDQLHYMFCRPVHGNSRAAFTLSTSNCVVTRLLDAPAVTSKSNLRLQARHFNGTETTGPSIVVSAYTREYRRDVIQAPTTSAVTLFTFKPTDDQSSAWTYTSTVFPPQQSPVAGASPTSQFVFPNNGRLYDFHLAITDNDATATKVAITYSYTRYVNSYTNKRATPGNPDLSREEYVFRTILCPEFRCLSFTTRQLVGSRSFFHTHYGTVPRGISAVISSQYNAGRPAFAFAVGSGDTTSAVRAGAAPSVPLLTGSDVAGGPIGILNCIDDLCSSASLQRSSDYLAGHRGSFVFTPTSLGVLVASIPVVALRPSPVFQSFRNPFSSPTAAHCTATEAGKQRSIDGEVFVCTALPDSPILDATAIFYWAPIATSIQSLVGVAPTSISNHGAGLQASLPTC